MELDENFDFSKTCRLCLTENNELISIYNKSSFEIEYSIIISECTGVMILENDELPKNICLECVECLNGFYQFRKLVVNSELRLIDFLNKFRKNALINKRNNIEEENLNIGFIEEPSILTCFIDNEKDPLSLEEDLDTLEEKLELDENETFTEHNSIILKSEENKTSFNFSQPNFSEDSYDCTKCRKSFSKLINLKRHQRLIHTDKKRHICKQCNKAFRLKSNLKQHEYTHTGEKLYSCMQCKKSFSRLFSLKVHVTFHKGEKSHVCKECNKGFCMKSDLKKHERIHTGERPFKCENCGKSYGHLSTLRIHEKNHKGKCGHPFIRLSDLNTTHGGISNKGNKYRLSSRKGSAF